MVTYTEIGGTVKMQFSALSALRCTAGFLYPCEVRFPEIEAAAQIAAVSFMLCCPGT